MSRPKYYWFEHIKKTVRRYPEKLKQDGTIQSAIAAYAIEKAIEDTKQLQDGDERLRMIELLYWRKDLNYKIDHAADAVYISPRLAQKWNSAFIYTVARYMGYK